MITAVSFLMIVASVPLLGGSLTKLGEVKLRQWWTIVASLVLQVWVISILAGSIPASLSAALHLASYGLAILFVWHNRHVAGMGVIVLGGMLNLLVIAANGGVMPAELDALETAGIISDSPTFENSAPVENARLAFLGDVFAIPEGIPFANVFSVGDILLVVGGGITVHTICDSRLGRLRRRTNPTPATVAIPVAAEVPPAPPETIEHLFAVDHRPSIRDASPEPRHGDVPQPEEPTVRPPLEHRILTPA